MKAKRVLVAHPYLHPSGGGNVVAESFGRENLTFTAQTPGAYRVEVWQDYKGKERGWIFSNPIYVEEATYQIKLTS